MSSAETYLDITDENCPMTFVRTKLCLERLTDGQILHVRLRDGDAKRNVPRAVADHGHDILGIDAMGDGIFELRVRKVGR